MKIERILADLAIFLLVGRVGWAINNNQTIFGSLSVVCKVVNRSQKNLSKSSSCKKLLEEGRRTNTQSWHLFPQGGI